MPRVCEVCGKGTTFGRSISRRGRAKSKGGIGKKTTGITKRTFKPNIQRVRVLENGGVRRKKVCAACIRSGAIRKAP
ncbi:MAG: 50S ribosomal protein L28 [Candidatus Brocadiae bacterium]|nr:50S ribosomal protein L28 [Candidatus Brocadiia bacterium]